jgi:hypothetical protein
MSFEVLAPVSRQILIKLERLILMRQWAQFIIPRQMIRVILKPAPQMIFDGDRKDSFLKTRDHY